MMMIQLRPLQFRPIPFPIASLSESVKLRKNPFGFMEECSEGVRLLEWSDGRRNRSDERYRVGVDREVVIEGIVE